QLRARRQVVDRKVEVDDQLVSGKLPAVAGARNGGQRPAVHDRDLSERVRPCTVSPRASQLSPRSPCTASRTPCCWTLRSSTAGRLTIISTTPSSVGEAPRRAAACSSSASRRWYGVCSANFSATLCLIVLMLCSLVDSSHLSIAL